MAGRKASTRAADSPANAGRAFEHPGQGLEGQVTTQRSASATVEVSRIKVGERHRRDMGDIAGLAASMGSVGLLQPIVVRPDGMLIAGERRLRAAALRAEEPATDVIHRLRRVLKYALRVCRLRCIGVVEQHPDDPAKAAEESGGAP